MGRKGVEYTQMERGLLRELNTIEGVLAEALEYTYDERYGWVIGDNTCLTLADELARKYRELEKENTRLREFLKVLADALIENGDANTAVYIRNYLKSDRLAELDRNE